ncbi:MAG: DUF4062 domain-containing protein [Chthoniobacterales bacterium]
MQPVPKVYVSATRSDLESARNLVVEQLKGLACQPITQVNYPTDVEKSRATLRAKLETCDAVVHVAGFVQGPEPGSGATGSGGRRSYPQLEFEIATELGLPCCVVLCGKGYSFDKHEAESEEEEWLQLAHRERLMKREEPYSVCDSEEELKALIRGLRGSVESLRAGLAEKQAKRRKKLLLPAVVLLVALAGGAYLYWDAQADRAAALSAASEFADRSELIATLLAEQERLRESTSGGGDVAARAEANVARTTNRSPEEIRSAVEQSVRSEQAAVAEADDPAAGAAALIRLAEAQRAAGQAAAAVVSLRKRLEMLEREARPVEWAEAAAALAEEISYSGAGAEESKSVLTEALEWARGNAELGPSHTTTLALMEALASIQALTPEESAELLREVLAARDRGLGPEDPKSLEAAMDLAAAEASLKNYVEADALFTRVIRSREAGRGPGAEGALEARSEYATSLVDQDRIAEAEALLRENVASSEKLNGAKVKPTLVQRGRLAEFLAREGQPAEASEMYRTLVADASESVGANNSLTLTFKAALAKRTQDEGKYEQAETMIREVIEALKQSDGSDQQLLAAMSTLGGALKFQGKSGEYHQLLEEKAEISSRVYGAQSMEVTIDQLELAVSYFLTGDLEKAVRPAEQSYKTRRGIAESTVEDILEPVDILCLIHSDASNWAELAKWSGTGLTICKGMAEPPADEVKKFEEYRSVAANRGVPQGQPED